MPRAGTLLLASPSTGHRLRHRTGARRSRATTRSTTSSTRTRGSARSCARPRDEGLLTADSLRRHAGQRRSGRARPGQGAAAPAGHRRRCGVRHGRRRRSLHSPRSWRRRFHAFYRDRRVVDAADPETSAYAAGAGRCDARHAGGRARPAGDLRAGVDVATTGQQAILSSGAVRSSMRWPRAPSQTVRKSHLHPRTSAAVRSGG